MQRYPSIEASALTNTHLAIGSFDGVHRGHRHLLERMVQVARSTQTTSAVLTFYPHPRSILSGKDSPSFQYLSSLEERLQLLENMGLDAVIIQTFDLDFAQVTASQFLNRLLESIRLSAIWATPQFGFGHQRNGDIALLMNAGQEAGFEVRLVEPLIANGHAISSSRIRTALAEGDIRLAADLLDRPYTLEGIVIHGDGRGRSIGVPTANLDHDPALIIPACGVYATRICLDRQLHSAVTNIGFRPTFLHNASPVPTVETHILDLNRDLYGSRLRLEFIERLREEKRFPDADSLLLQVRKDIDSVRSLMEETA